MVDLQSWIGLLVALQQGRSVPLHGSTVQVLNTRKNDGSILYEMELYDGEQSMSEQNKEVPDMNEWDRLHRQAQRYKEAYPPGTRIMLLGMGNDPNPVESGTRGTVRVVDDIGTRTVISTMAGASALSPAKIPSAS